LDLIAELLNDVLHLLCRWRTSLDVFSERFTMPADLMYSYVMAVIDTSVHLLSVYLGEDFFISFEYPMPVGEESYRINRGKRCGDTF
jgi:hypothetical protein